MSMDTKQPDPASPQSGETDEDAIPEGYQTATFGFFEKHKKKILYTAGIFALVSFSVTGALLGFFDYLTGTTGRAGPEMTVAGETVQVTPEDIDVARRLNNGMHEPVPALIVPARDDRMEVLAALRRLAIHAGLEISDTEVEKILATTVKARQVEGVDDLPSRVNRRTVADLRAAVGEALRISQYVRLNLLSVDTTDQAAVDAILDDGEVQTLQVASIDKKAIEKELEDGLGEGNAAVLAWFEGLDKDELRSFGYLDTNLAALDIVALPYEGFDAAAFSTIVENLTIPDTEIDAEVAKIRAERDVAAREQKIKDAEDNADGGEDGGDPPEDGETPDGGSVGEGPQELGGLPQPPPSAPNQVPQAPNNSEPVDEEQAAKDREEAKRRLQVKAVLTDAWSKIRAERETFLSGVFEARNQAGTDRTSAETARSGAEAALEADPENEDLKKALAEAEADVEAKAAAAEAAQEAYDARRLEFNVLQVLGDAVPNAGAFTTVSIEPARNSVDLQDLGDLGKWRESWQGANSAAGELSMLPASTSKALFHFQVTELIDSPRKDYEEIKDRVKTEYLRVRSDEIASEKREAFEEALLEMGKVEMGGALAEITDSRETRIKDVMDAWRTGLTDTVTKAQAELARLVARNIDASARPMMAAQTRLRDAQAALEGEAAHRTTVEEDVDAEIEADIEEAAKEHYHKVMVAAAEQAGWDQEAMVMRRGAAADPWFMKEASDSEKFIAASAAMLKADESTDVLDDLSNRAVRMAVCTAIEPLTRESLRRRDIMKYRGSNSASAALMSALQQSFSLDALKTRYGWREASEDDGETASPAN